MTTETAIREWVELPSGLYVSADRMQKDEKMFTLYDAANMDIEAFNTLAKEYNIRIEESDPPIDRLVKYSILLSRMKNDGSFILTNEEYVKMALDVAAGKAKEEEQFASFYKTLMSGFWDATREVLEFKEKIARGSNKDKYIAERLVFNEDAELENTGDIIVAPEGWTRVIGTRYGYPIETSSDLCTVENIENPALEGADMKGYWYVGSEPVGEQRLALRGPYRGHGRLLNAGVDEGRSYSIEGVAALRLRGARPEDYVAQIRKFRTEAVRLHNALASIQTELEKLAEKE